MAQKKISELTAAGALTGAELVPIVQTGATVRTTTQDIANLGGGGSSTTEHVEKITDFVVSTADTKKLYVINSASAVVATLPDLSAEVVDYEWALIVTNTGGGSVDPDGNDAESSNGVDFNFADQWVIMYLFYNSEEGVYYLQNGTAGGATGDLQDVLDAGSTATITTDLDIIRTGELSLTLRAATGITLNTTNEPITINAGVLAGGSSFLLNVDAANRLIFSNHNDHYTTGGVAYHRFFNGASAGHIRLMEASGNGSNYIGLKAPEDVTTAQTYTFPASGPSNNGDLLASTTAGQLSWTPAVSPIGVQDLFVSAAAMWPRLTGGCADLAKTEMATSVVNIQTLDFDQTTQEFAQFQIVLPRKYNNGTVTAVVYWTASAGSGTVQWGISGGAYSNDDALTVALGTAQTADDTLIATNDLHISPATSAITLAGTPADADFLIFQISRNPASDTLSADAKLLGVSIRITTDAGTDA